MGNKRGNEEKEITRDHPNLSSPLYSFPDLKTAHGILSHQN